MLGKLLGRNTKFHHLYCMRTRRLTSGLLRTALAVVFGFVSLLHGPVMTFAHVAAPAPVHHATDAGRHVHHQHGTAGDAVPVKDATMAGCNAFGCLIAVEAMPARAPAAILMLLGALSPGIASAMLAADIEPIVPPPRLRA
jgi:hypothetical protein